MKQFKILSILLLSFISLSITAQVNRYTQIQWSNPTYEFHPSGSSYNYNTYKSKRQNQYQEKDYNTKVEEYKAGYTEGYKYGYRDAHNSYILLPCVVGVIYPPDNGEYTYSNGYSNGYRQGYIDTK